MMRYTGPNLFAVSAALPLFLQQGNLPVMGFVLSCRTGLSIPLTVSKDMDFGLSVASEIDFTQRL